MPKLLPSTWSKCLPLVYRRICGNGWVKGSFNEPPLCEGRKIEKPLPKCHPKPPSCTARSGKCMDHPKVPECTEPDEHLPVHLSCCCNHNLKKDPCDESPKKQHPHKDKEPFISMWEDCGIQKECPNENERLDDKHYEPSETGKRVYTQTWENCGPVMRPNKRCSFEDMCSQRPPFKKRTKHESPATAKEQDSEQLKEDYNGIKKCMENVLENPNTKKINKCHKIVMPCCRKVAAHIKCHNNRGHSHCKKDCCPHPSFSECDHPAARIAHLDECHCTGVASQCEANRFLVVKKMFQVPPPLPAWPPKERPK